MLLLFTIDKTYPLFRFGKNAITFGDAYNYLKKD